jgi:hypothetical protein
VRPQGRDWAPLIVLAVAGSVAVAGGCFLGGYALGYAQPRPVTQRSAAPTAEPTPTASPNASPSESPTPTATPTLTPTPTATPTSVQCSFGDFPTYPGSVTAPAPAKGSAAWHTTSDAGKVTTYYSNGAGQLVWQFRLSSATASRSLFYMSRAPSCRGVLYVMPDPTGTFYQAFPNSQ